eukprot:2768648-Rhodomonas_salina.1
MRCPVLALAMLLRMRYAMSSTDVRYAGTRREDKHHFWDGFTGTSLRACYAMSGTKRAYGICAVRYCHTSSYAPVCCYTIAGACVAYGASTCLRACCAIPSTDDAYQTTVCCYAIPGTDVVYGTTSGRIEGCYGGGGG